MSEKVAVIISPNWKDYANKHLAECIESIRRQDWTGDITVFITDNKSTDESYSFIKITAPEAEIIRNSENAGYARANNQAMRLALDRGFDYIILFNMDIIASDDCVARLVNAAERDALIGAVQARLMLWPEKDIINSLGNVTHFLGFGYSMGYREPASRFDLSNARPICFPSGAAVLFKAHALKSVGLFDEEFWMYNEDQDLGWRLWLAGFKCVLEPRAVAYHKYSFTRGAEKYYYLDRNRISALIKNYHWLTILLILPAFAVMEIGVLAFSIKNGWFKEKIKVYSFFLNTGRLSYLYNERKQTQRIRKTKDRDITAMFSGTVWYQEIDSIALRLANLLLNAYWKTIRSLIFW